MEKKAINIQVTKDEHTEIKIRAAQQGLTIKEYILALVEKDLNK